MFCTKCGKEIDENARFCWHCGSPVGSKAQKLQEEPSNMAAAKKVENIVEPVSRPGNRKKWVVPVCIAAGVAVLAAVGAAAVNLTKTDKGDTQKVEQIKTAEAEKEPVEEKPAAQKPAAVPDAGTEKESAKEEPLFQEHAFTPDAETEAGLKQFVSSIAWADFFGHAQITAYDDAEFCKQFLFFATRMDYDIGRVLNKYSLVPGPELMMSESDVTDFLQNSLGKCELDNMIYKDGQIMAAGGDPGSRWVENVVFNNMTQISETDIRLEGVAYYKSEGEDVGTGTFVITMTQNPDSVWGDYTLKSIDSWVRELINDSNYILWNSDSSYYTEDNLSYMCAYDLYLARNEIYARHGYIFDSPDLQEYFGGKTWYIPAVKDVPDSALNDYERANVQLLLSLENGKTASSSEAEVQNDGEEPESVLGEYLVFLVNAVNSGDYTGAEKVMLKGSPLYQEQEALVEKLHSENTTEELKTWSIADKEQIDDTHVRLISDEVILVTYGDGTSKTLYQSFAYTCELTEDGWLFTSLSAAD